MNRIPETQKKINEIMVRLNDMDAEALSKLSSKNKIARAVLARQAVSEFLAKHGVRPPKIKP